MIYNKFDFLSNNTRTISVNFLEHAIACCVTNTIYCIHATVSFLPYFIRHFGKLLLSGPPQLSGQLAYSRGWPLNRGLTVISSAQAARNTCCTTYAASLITNFRKTMFSIVGLHETAEVLKREASLPDPKPEVTPVSTPINKKTRFNHTGTVTPIMSTPETPSLSRFRFGDPGTPTGKVSEVFKENYTRDRVVWRFVTPDSSPCSGSLVVYFSLCLAHRSSK